MYLQKVPISKNFEKSCFFVGFLSDTDEKSRIQIRKSTKMSRIHNTAENDTLRKAIRYSTYLTKEKILRLAPKEQRHVFFQPTSPPPQNKKAPKN